MKLGIVNTTRGESSENIAVNSSPLFTRVPVDVRDQRPPTDHTAFDMRRSKIIESKKEQKESENNGNIGVVARSKMVEGSRVTASGLFENTRRWQVPVRVRLVYYVLLCGLQDVSNCCYYIGFFTNQT